MSRWRTVKKGNFGSIPKIPGVFALYVGGKLIYIGQGFNVGGRVKETVRNLKALKEDHFAKVSFSTYPLDWVIRKERLVARLSPERNPSYFTHKDLKALSNKGNGYLEPPNEIVIDPAASWMVGLRSNGMSSTQITTYLNKIQDKKRWTPNAVHNLLTKYDRSQQNV